MRGLFCFVFFHNFENYFMVFLSTANQIATADFQQVFASFVCSVLLHMIKAWT